MPSTAVHPVRDLTPEVRQAFESVLGRPLAENENVTISAAPMTVLKEAPTGAEREEAFRRLFEHMDRMAERVKDVPDEELDEVIDEALRSVRPGYQPIR